MLTFFALLKFTFALPLLAFAFWKGSRAQRLAMVVAIVLFILLNAFAASFGLGGLNDVRTPDGQSARLDMESLLVAFPHTSVT